MVINAKEVLSEFQHKLEPMLAEYFEKASKEMDQISQEAKIGMDILQEYSLRKAKRIRAALMYYTYLMMGGKQKQEVLKASMFIEIIQSYLLIHDDIMDEDSLRRGGTTVHKIYEKHHQKHYVLQDPKHFGESMAICLGDVASHLAMKLLSESKFPAEQKIRAISRLHQQIMTVGFGQMMDVVNSVKASVSYQDVITVHKYKTATYTYETPISVGAILAGASEKDVKTLSNFAIPAGIAFQIQDDILGMFGDEDKLGKPTISDLREGKHTLLIIKALEKASRKQIKTITQALGNSNITPKAAEEVRSIVIETGSLEYSKQLAVDFVYKAKEALAKMPSWNGIGRAFLDGIADYMINREF